MSSENNSKSHIENLPADTQALFKEICKHFALPDGTHPTKEQQQEYLQYTVNEDKLTGRFSSELLRNTKER